MWPLNFHSGRRWTALVFLLGAAPLIRAEIKAGDVFPDLRSAGLEGAAPAVQGHVVLVDFWASWCAPCKASFPAYAQLHQAYAARGLVVIAVSVDEDETAYARFVKRLAPPFAVVRDKDQQLVRAVMVPAMPTSFLIGRDGRVTAVHRGFHGGETEAALRQEIEALLETPSPSS